MYASWTDAFKVGYSFLSVSGDPWFDLLTAVFGMFLCSRTGLVALLVDGWRSETYRDDIAIVSAFVVLGFGSSVLRISPVRDHAHRWEVADGL